MNELYIFMAVWDESELEFPMERRCGMNEQEKRGEERGGEERRGEEKRGEERRGEEGRGKKRKDEKVGQNKNMGKERRE